MVVTGSVTVEPFLRVYVTSASTIVAVGVCHSATSECDTPSMPEQKPAHVSRTASRPITASAFPKRNETSSARWSAKRSGSIESMSANSVLRDGMRISSEQSEVAKTDCKVHDLFVGSHVGDEEETL